MTERNEHDERGDRRVFEPAIARLREELADFERQASATRALIEALVARAGATDSMRTKIGTPKTPPRERHSPRATSDAQKRAPAPRHNTAPVKADGAKELAEIVAVVARSERDTEAAIRSKDVARLKMAVIAIARAERRGGELLVKLGGRFKPLPVSQTDRKRWRAAAARSSTAFDAKLKRDIAAALTRISSNEAGVAVDKAKPPAGPPAPARPAKRPCTVSAPQPPINKLSDWHQETDGSLTRTVTSVEDDVAAVPGGV